MITPINGKSGRRCYLVSRNLITFTTAKNEGRGFCRFPKALVSISANRHVVTYPVFSEGTTRKPSMKPTANQQVLHHRGNYLVRRQRLAPGEATPWHRDPFHRVTVVLAGD